MGAVLPATVSVSSESFPAAAAGKAVHSYTVDLLRMGISPFLPASRRAELDPYDAITLGDGLSAAEADGRIIRRVLGAGAFAGKAVPLAVALWGGVSGIRMI